MGTNSPRHTTGKVRKLTLILVVSVSILSLSFSPLPQPSGLTGTVIRVTTTKDVLANDGKCSLREAVIAANTNLPSGSSAGECPAGKSRAMDTILLAPRATYILTLNSTNENYAKNGDLDIRNNRAKSDLMIKVRRNRKATIKQNARRDDRVFDILGANVIFQGVTLTGGGRVGSGGGIQNSGKLTLVACTVSGNKVSWVGGGIFNKKTGKLTMNSSKVVGNTSKVHGGGIMNEGNLTLNMSTVSGNFAAAGGGSGGGIVNRGTLIVDASTVSGNISGQLAGGIGNWAGGIATIRNGSLIGSSNTATEQGGGVLNEGQLSVISSTISGNSSEYGGGITNWKSGVLTVTGSTISQNNAISSVFSSGGGITNWGGVVTLSNSTISANMATWAGGIFIEEGSLTLNATSVSNNTSSNDAGGIQVKAGAAGATVLVQSGSSVSNNTGSWGAGISNWGGTLTVNASTVSGNTATNSGGGLLNKDGGSMVVENGSVISGNSAQWEGGISNWGGSDLTVTDSVISTNTATVNGGGIGNLGTMTVTGSALLGNTATGEGDAVYSNVDIPNATSVTGSCIGGNGDTAVYNSQAASQLATGNWWGDASGPSGSGSGTGDSVGTNVDFSSWLALPPAICAP